MLDAGVAGALASALSMATGAFLAERSEQEVAAANVERERQEIAEHPEEEQEELSLFYQLKGLDPAAADALAAKQAQVPEAMLRVLTKTRRPSWWFFRKATVRRTAAGEVSLRSRRTKRAPEVLFHASPRVGAW